MFVNDLIKAINNNVFFVVQAKFYNEKKKDNFNTTRYYILTNTNNVKYVYNTFLEYIGSTGYWDANNVMCYEDPKKFLETLKAISKEYNFHYFERSESFLITINKRDWSNINLLYSIPVNILNKPYFSLNKMFDFKVFLNTLTLTQEIKKFNA